MNLTDKDLQQLKQHGISLQEVNSQIKTFKSGIPFTVLEEAATIGQGITALSDALIEEAIAYFESHKKGLTILKFVPASGAATRMFKFLFQFVNEYDPRAESINRYINLCELKDLSVFMVGLQKFPFFVQVKEALETKGIDLDSLSESEKIWHFAHTMLDKEQLAYGSYPKGLLPFHNYKGNVISTAFEEHLFESALYPSDNDTASLHFTVSDKHLERFTEEFERIQHKVEEKTGVTFQIDFSFQQSATDTIAVTPDNKPFRQDDGSLLFRPAGHGALLRNLNSLDADIVFIKNIDNVVVCQYKEEVAKYKKVLAGILMRIQKDVFNYMKLLDTQDLDSETLKTLQASMTEDLNIKITEDFEKYSEQVQLEYLRDKLNRPIRVCGMVKNEGEPGGGPFWIRKRNGQVSLQIVESAQVDLANVKQKKLFKEATHFNPVDLVCGLKDYRGHKFNLEAYVDEKTAFITNKTQSGKDLKAMERPGLWNGSMAFWNTVFVEVPIITFNPVKTVNDLLKPQHQRAIV